MPEGDALHRAARRLQPLVERVTQLGVADQELRVAHEELGVADQEHRVAHKEHRVADQEQRVARQEHAGEEHGVEPLRFGLDREALQLEPLRREPLRLLVEVPLQVALRARPLPSGGRAP